MKSTCIFADIAKITSDFGVMLYGKVGKGRLEEGLRETERGVLLDFHMNG